jgi:hypothetical protein
MTMKVIEKARQDLAAILVVHGSPLAVSRATRLMGQEGWNITLESMPETARAMGFPVIGVMIYGLDD